MATIQGKLDVQQDGVAVASWLAVTEADTGSGLALARFPDKTVQVTGDFTTSGAITMQGSNDGSTWATLHDPQGSELVLTDSSLKLISENPLYIRPTATAGTAVSMNVYVVGSPR